MANFQQGPVIIEEKIEGEESSFQAFCDGKHLVPLPDTRDYKRAFDDDHGPNTGGMGSYKNVGGVLPFATNANRIKEMEIVNRIFEKWKGNANGGLRGMPFYVAFMHTGKETKILENNSRPGDPEIINILPILKDDFVDTCFKILEGNLARIEVEKEATVVTYKVPPNYGGYMDTFPQRVDKGEIGKPVDLTKAYELTEKYGDKIRVYPATMELRNGETYALKSRAVGVVGVGENIETARQISLEGVKAIKGGALWHRKDIASKQHIEKSIRHMEEWRRKQ
jgi:phosphoribosylamine--glycine ligase